MKNRAYIKNKASTTFWLAQYLKNEKLTKFENLHYWLFESKESFHGHTKNGFFEFADARIPDGFKLELKHITLEFSQEEEEGYAMKGVC